MLGHRHWPTSQLVKPLPPPLRNMPERPTKNKRKPEFVEGRDGMKKNKNFVERDFKQNKCGNCGGLDHYKKTCKNPSKSNEASTSAAPVKGGRSKQHPSITPPTTSLSPTATQTTTTTTTNCGQRRIKHVARRKKPDKSTLTQGSQQQLSYVNDVVDQSSQV
ncbi:uncharacterized protein LOC130818544 isoform X1 [Amaranthus tricolor]|uniref:uncharacterized protein LOC130818544 isoform X1 n=1 Tax=Amaranthus tricolor TaxID=29722 RepID=UPI00258BAC2E|nr:uncharacterized protein LOC130818544 isoform X1 [Amaranthus tricolor]XP_057540693.1 uncharacterized protein LOC130818544 isoform X1 [Amaranthus tricolor]XP_057540694.1 uncharacterized protein LOC130818544 isoform X1 [Amaranthus tricolor]